MLFLLKFSHLHSAILFCSILAVGNAFAVLNDPAKRKKYDMFGPEEEQQTSRSRRDYDYTHGFEG